MQTDILELFIEEIKQEFKDENWDYLTYVAERVREKQKEKIGAAELICKEYNGIYTIRKTEFDLNGLDIAEMTTNHPLEKQKEFGELFASAPALYRENKELKEAVKGLCGIITANCDWTKFNKQEFEIMESANAILSNINH